MQNDLKEYLDIHFKVVNDALGQVQRELNDVKIKVDTLGHDNTGNKKDIEYMQSDFKELKDGYEKDVNKLWSEFRKARDAHEPRKAACMKELEKKINDKVATSNLAIKLWVVGAALTAAASIIAHFVWSK